MHYESLKKIIITTANKIRYISPRRTTWICFLKAKMTQTTRRKIACALIHITMKEI